MKKYKMISLFSGAGGMDLGFEKENFTNVFSVEFDKKIAKTYKKNFPNNNLFVGDIRDVDNKKINELMGNEIVDVVIGGPPCQGFSMAGNIGRKFVDDPRNQLFKEFVRVVNETQPKIFVMENVARLQTHNKGQTIKEIIDEFEKVGYYSTYKVLQAADYGVPQKRQRIFIVGTKDPDFEFKFPEGFGTTVTVKEAIGNLPPLKSGEVSNVTNHFAMNHSEQMLEKMSYVSDGGDRNEIPEEIRPKSGDIRKYIRYSSDKPSVTVTGDMRKIFHYNQNRALTPRELARLQTFPDVFIFEGDSISIQQQIGNAVPPKLAEVVAKEVYRSLEELDD